MSQRVRFGVKAIGVIRTPYLKSAPPAELRRNYTGGEFRIELFPEYADGLADLERFSHVHVLYFLDRIQRPCRSLSAHPPMLDGRTVGVFASRSPHRPNPIALSVVRLLGIEGRVLRIAEIDALDRTPLLDIKPYFGSADPQPGANDGWMADYPSRRAAWIKQVRAQLRSEAKSSTKSR